MASPLERREREKQELRGKILDAARELFVTHGYDAVTMRKVAEKIEYSPTAIYLHFKDKEALILELCHHDFRTFAEGFLEIARVADPIERLRKAGWEYLAFATQHPQHYRLMFMTPRPIVETPGEEANDPAQNAYVFLRAAIEEAIDAKRLRPGLTDAELLAQTSWATMHGVVSLEIAMGSEQGWVNWRPLEDRTRMVLEMILRGMVVDFTPEPPTKKKRR